MSWSIGYDANHKRDIGYAVPSTRDHPDCNLRINRGLSYVCGGVPYGGDGCGLFFCGWHLSTSSKCQRCEDNSEQGDFPLKPDTKDWMEWKLIDASWAEWRNENPNEVKAYKELLDGQPDIPS